MKTHEFYELNFDKFNLRVPKGYWFAGYDTWVKVEDNVATVGMTDFLQTKVGDIAFFTPVESDQLEQDDILGTIESIKATIELTMPVTGKVLMFNPKLSDQPELISQDSYGEGWIVKVDMFDWDSDQIMLLPAEKYFKLMQEKVKNALEN